MANKRVTEETVREIYKKNKLVWLLHITKEGLNLYEKSKK